MSGRAFPHRVLDSQEDVLHDVLPLQLLELCVRSGLRATVWYCMSICCQPNLHLALAICCQPNLHLALASSAGASEVDNNGTHRGYGERQPRRDSLCK